MEIEDVKLLESWGWTLECEIPLEISHEDGSRATGKAAGVVFEELKRGSRPKQTLWDLITEESQECYKFERDTIKVIDLKTLKEILSKRNLVDN